MTPPETSLPRVWERLDTLAEQTAKNEIGLAVHETECIGRYNAIMARLYWLTCALMALVAADLFGVRDTIAIMLKAIGPK